METRGDVLIGTFCSQTKLIVDVAVESAASVLQSFGPERADSKEKQVRTKARGRVYMTLKTPNFFFLNFSKYPEQNPTVTSGFAGRQNN